MLLQEICDNINLIKGDRIVRTLAICISFICIFISIFVSFLVGVIIYVSYIFGFIVSWLLVLYRNKVVICLQHLTSIYHEHLLTKKQVVSLCSVCDNFSCRRHQKTKSITPWKHIFISKDLNSAIENIYNRIIENFINSWYKQFTDDNDFINEIKYCLRYSSASVVNRFLEINIGELLSKRILPCIVKHIDDYLYMKQIGNLKHARFNDVIVEYLGTRLHAAATNRKNELEYLQHLASSVLTHILPDDYFKCRNYNVLIREILAGWILLPLMDVLADPNIINYLVILTMTYKSKKQSKICTSDESVEFLCNFDSKYDGNLSSFATNLNKIKNNTSLLYAFMQFLKKQDHVNLLQFCLDVDHFNVKLLTPDLSKNQIEELHTDALKLYKDYLDKDGCNFIGCPSEIVQDFEHLIQEYYSVEKLTSVSKLLYKAYDQTFNTLETVWLPKFFHSIEFYSHICGSRVLPTYNKQAIRQKKYDSPNQGAVSKLSSSLGKIKGVLKSAQPVDGAFYSVEVQPDNAIVGDILLSECNPLFRDMSTWKVWISTFQTSSNKVVHFYVNVERTGLLADETRKSWSVWRKDQDFYTLKAKLVEFHGENEICDSPLPSRKAGSFIEARMTKYEEFVKKLLQKPLLRGSDLLHSFLTVEEDFTLYITTNAGNIQDFGNIYQSMAYKLRKEKGQNLDSFMDAFLKSTGAFRNEKLEWGEIGEALDPLNANYYDKLIMPKTYKNHIFNDNFGMQRRNLKEAMSSSFNPETFTECLFYLLKRIFQIPNGLLKLYASICSIAEKSVDTMFKVIAEQKLKTALSQPNLAYLIKQLEVLIFTPHVSPTKEELEDRKKKAFDLLDEAFPSIWTKFLGNNINTGAKTILEILQNPHYNKQLAYNLLDIIIIEMYPMLNTKEEHYGLT